MIRNMKNFIFDLYGTLADVHTDEFSKDFWVRLKPYFLSLSKKEIDFESEFNGLMVKYTVDNEHETDIARILYELFLLAGVRYTREQIYAIGHELRLQSTQKLRLYPGTKEALISLKQRGNGVYLLSNAQAMFTLPEIDGLGLTPLFDGIEISSDFGWRKPSVKFFDYIVNKYGLKKEDCVYIGNDYGNDICGALAAGITPVYIRTETSPVEDEPAVIECVHFLDGCHKKLYGYLNS